MSVETFGDQDSPAHPSTTEVQALEADTRLAALALEASADNATEFLNLLVAQRLDALKYKNRRAEALHEADLRRIREADAALEAAVPERDVMAARRRLDAAMHYTPREVTA